MTVLGMEIRLLPTDFIVPRRDPPAGSDSLPQPLPRRDVSPQQQDRRCHLEFILLGRCGQSPDKYRSDPTKDNLRR